ncbi:MAG: DUF655 domain-containing protein [Candidatus Thermoplasmatota archaeon]
MEDYAYIIDYLAQGPLDRKYKREPVAYAVGDKEFKLLLLQPKPGAILSIGERVYIGKEIEKREKILHVKRRIGYRDLTSSAQNALPQILLEIVEKNEERFVNFFNGAESISTRFHALELLPTLGKKSMWAIVEERKKGPFKSFEDISKRVQAIRKPAKIIAKRVENELSNETEKYRLFTA